MTSVLDTASTIRWDRDDDGIVTLTLDDPESAANAMNGAYRRSMAAAVRRLERERDQITGVIVTSAKSTFSAGADLDELVMAGPADRAWAFELVTETKAQLRRLETLGVPVVAAVNGTALGGGMEIALACHHRVVLADQRIRLGLPEVTFGLLPGAGGVVRTVRLLGLVPALTEVLLRGPRLRPDAALRLGLVDELATDEQDLAARAREYIRAAPQSRQRFDVQVWKVPGGTPSTPALARLLPALSANLVKELKGAPHPAPRYIVSAAVEGLQVDLETAFAVETRYLVDLICGQVSTNLIQALWFDLNRVKSGRSRPADVAAYRPSRVAVLGAGMMGAGIAHVCAKAGLDVVLKDVTKVAAEAGKQRVATSLDGQVRRGRLSAAGREEVLARIVPTGDSGRIAGCDVVVEAVFEDLTLKHRVLAEAEVVLAAGAAPATTLLCSNTSTLPIGDLATAVMRPANVVGLHFFSPVEKMPLVEIVVGAQTSREALARACDVVRHLGKTPLVVGDTRGFFTSRVFGTLVLEGAALLGEGTAPMTVERAAQQAGFPTGPLTLLDEVMLTLPLSARDAETEARRSAGLPPTPEHPGLAVLREMVDRGRTGRAAGGGFFDWDGGKRLWPGLAGVLTPTAGPVPFPDARDRMLFAMAVDTARCLEEGVLSGAEDANVGSILGIGFPALYGGAAQFVDQYDDGVIGFLERAGELADRYGERFRPPPLLTDRASVAGSLRAALAGSAGRVTHQ